MFPIFLIILAKEWNIASFPRCFFSPFLQPPVPSSFPQRTYTGMILCIRTGMPFIHCSTCSLISSDWAFLSSSSFSSMRNCVSSVYVNDVPSILKCVSAYGKSFIEPFTLPGTNRLPLTLQSLNVLLRLPDHLTCIYILLQYFLIYSHRILPFLVLSLQCF